MGFKDFFSKLGMTQDAHKAQVNDSQSTVATQAPSSRTSDDDLPYPPRLRIIQGVAATPVKITSPAFAQDAFTTPSQVNTTLLGRKLSEALPFPKKNKRRQLSAKQALEQMHGRLSPFVSPPTVSKVPANFQPLPQQVEATVEASKSTNDIDSVPYVAQPQNAVVDSPANLAKACGERANSATIDAIEDQDDEASLTTIEEPLVWVSETAENFLNTGAGPAAPSFAEKQDQSKKVPTLGFDVVAEQSEGSTSSSSGPSETTSSPAQTANVSTPFTPAETGNPSTLYQQCTPLDAVAEEGINNEASPREGLDSPCPMPRPLTTIIRTTCDIPPVEEHHEHGFHFHVHANIAPVEEESHEDDGQADMQQLQDALSQKESLNQGLRLQLLEQEEEVARLQKQLQATQRERDLYEAEQDASVEEMQKLHKAIAVKDKQISEESTKANDVLRQLQNARSSIGLGSGELLAEQDQARQQAQAEFHRAQTLQTIANAVTAERPNLAQRIAHIEAIANMNAQRHEAEAMELRAKVDHMRNAGMILEQQLNYLVGLKDTAEARVEELEVRVQSLLQDVTAKWLENPVDAEMEGLVNPGTQKPNELHDVKQAFELSQAKLMAVAEVNQDLHDTAAEREKELTELRQNNELLKDKAARLSSSFEIWMSKLDNWMQTIPGIVKMHDEIEEIPGLKELLEESVFHEQCIAKELRDKGDLVSQLEAKILKLERKHGAEIEALERHASEVQKAKARLDTDNYELACHTEDARKESEALKVQLAQCEDEVQQWKAQCLEQAYGDTVEIIEAQQKAHIKHYTDQVEALQNRCDLFFRAKERAEGDWSTFRVVVGEQMAGVADLGAERDWYQQQVEALRQRFEHELLVWPLKIPYQPAHSHLSAEEKEAVIAGEDRVIAKITGYLTGRSAARPRNVQVLEVWEGFVAWALGKAEDDTTGKGKGTARAELQPELPTMTPLPPPNQPQQA
ncbi:hypothetical protein A1O1_07337 [Capronia coronata CBS 617.96]|uniref:Uncharacterized protein n=1 Tax=Capronia coronata CBS 617.96 TaxID=1182541 RepID=W9XT20_9EURO|nr:uncharacterized protein A1O1_07337 [Capronia coronata CBS 617.96]EXJ83712.1 hypothetical protein A1O1_07337 [Capronia coronata CBS 617.96]